MNVPDYLKELLLQNNEVSVPGLGAFSMVRKNAVYNEKEGKFYPPYHQVKFNPQPKDDNLFVKYLAEKKNILFDTANYIVEKFVSALVEQAANGNTAFADIGWFSKSNNELIFKPNDKLVIDPSFYGYAPIALEKLHIDKPKPVYVAPAPIAPVISVPVEETYTPLEPVESIYDEPEEQQKVKDTVSVWFILLMVFISGAVILFCTCLIFPTFADRLETAYKVIIHNKTDDTVVSKKKIIPILAKKTDEEAIPAQFIDSAKTTRFEIFEAAFVLKPYAIGEVRKLKGKGVIAKIITDDAGPLLKVSVGTYYDYKTADSALRSLLNSGKIKKDSYIKAISTPK